MSNSTSEPSTSSTATATATATSKPDDADAAAAAAAATKHWQSIYEQNQKKATDQFTIVYIPQNETIPMSEMIIDLKDKDVVTVLVEQLKQHFNAVGSSESKEQVRASIRNLIAEQQKKQGLPPQEIDDKMIDMVMSMSTVDTIPLMNNKKATDYIGLSMYVDDQGIAKKLPLNKRATAICIACHNQLQVLGDAFIARYYDDENDFYRCNFTLSELQVHGKQDQTTPYPTRSSTDVRAFTYPQLSTLPFVKACQAAASTPDHAQTQELATMMRRAGMALPSNTQTQVDPSKVSRICGLGLTECSKQGSLRCGGCKAIYYCSNECQKRDWKRHRPVCKKTDAK